jgi:O-antigen ligase
VGRPIVNIWFDRLIHQLVCLYAFFIPLELILEVFFDIDTILKPYRVLAIIIILVFVVRSLHRIPYNVDLKYDWFLYALFTYGLIITGYRMLSTAFGMSHFYNDVFQMGLYLGVFIVIRHSDFSMRQVLKVFHYLTLGVLVNSIYIFNTFYIVRDYERHAGFMDNPNYTALSILIILLYLILQLPFKSFFGRFWSWVAILFFFYIFIIAGSRTAFLVLVLIMAGVIAFTTLRGKLVMLSVGGFFLLFLLVGRFNAVKTEGPLILFERLHESTWGNDPRLPTWRGVIRASVETDFIGLGIGQFKARFHEFFYDVNDSLIRRIISRGYFLSPHSDYFAVLITYGIVGLILFVIFLTRALIKNIKAVFQSNSMQEKQYAQLVLFSLGAIVLFGITAENFNSALYWIILSLCSKTVSLSS